MKKMMLALTFAMALSVLAGCGAAGGTRSDGTEQIANPFVDCTDMTAASKVAGFTMTLPPEVAAVEKACTYSAIKDSMIQVVYIADDGRTVTLRKGAGTEPIDGDYNTYEHETTQDVAGMKVKLRGDGDTIATASWTSGGYAFAVVAIDAPLPSERMIALVEGLG